MSDPDEHEMLPKEISPEFLPPGRDELMRFLAEKNIVRCDACSIEGDIWVYSTTGSFVKIEILDPDGSPKKERMGRPSLLVSCCNCGNTKIFSTKIVNDWLWQNQT